MSSKRRAARTALVAGTVIALAAGLAACGGESLEDKGGSKNKGGGKGEIVIGSAGFTESKVLAEIYSRVLDNAGYEARVQTLANRELYEPALEKGQIDVVPEYASTLAEFLNAKKNGAKAKPVASSDIDKTVTELKKLAEPRGLKVLAVGEATDQNAFAVTKEFAAQHKLKTLSDLGRSKQKIRLASGEECETRVFCKPGLEKTYGIDITAIDPKGVGTPPAKQAVKDGTDQLVLTTTTDATLDSFGLVLLEDDKNLQNADNVLPVVNAKSAGDKEIETVPRRAHAHAHDPGLDQLEPQGRCRAPQARGCRADIFGVQGAAEEVTTEKRIGGRGPIGPARTVSFWPCHEDATAIHHPSTGCFLRRRSPVRRSRAPRARGSSATTWCSGCSRPAPRAPRSPVRSFCGPGTVRPVSGSPNSPARGCATSGAPRNG